MSITLLVSIAFEALLGAPDPVTPASGQSPPTTRAFQLLAQGQVDAATSVLLAHRPAPGSADAARAALLLARIRLGTGDVAGARSLLTEGEAGQKLVSPWSDLLLDEATIRSRSPESAREALLTLLEKY